VQAHRRQRRCFAASEGGGLVSPSDQHVDSLLESYLRRNRKLQRWAWISLLAPLVLFVSLSVLTVRKAKEYDQKATEYNQLKAKKDQLDKQSEEQQQQLVDKQAAINIVKAGTPGVRPNVVIYRPLIAGRVDYALGELGYSVDLRSNQGNPSLADKPVDTLSYGCAVSNEDIRTVAAALTKADLPIRRITPATKNKDPNLIQVISSAHTDLKATPLSADAISNWSRADKPCP
jgi:hypothetical protein